ncbi:enteropeptidase-like [Orbicella faveolata]|uniref:enteropeptidase-like n=1 Tax=Orbicella faveolata TaxID=48498 RepID=UPI0009E5E1E5|nr:enteropeptidase-like [Orbicella faveolata]
MLVFILLTSLVVSLAAKDCDFESGKCGWINDCNSFLKWNRRQGFSHTGKGYFMSMDASKGMLDDNAGLYTKFKGDTCLTFWYNMRGNGAGSIEVRVDMGRLVLELKGPKDTDWHKAQVEVTKAKRKVRLRSRSHYAGEI